MEFRFQEIQGMYSSLQKAGYILIFKPVLPDKDGKVKGNVDADLVLQVMIQLNNYDHAVIVSSDGDFYSLVNYLYEKPKKSMFSLATHNCSLRHTA